MKRGRSVVRKRVDGRVARCPLYGISPLFLSTIFRLPLSTCVEWKRSLRKKPQDAAAIARLVNGELGAFDERWSGFVIAKGMLWTPESIALHPAQVVAVPYYREQVAEWERAQRWMQASSVQDQRMQQIGKDVTGLLLEAIEALRQRPI